MTAQVKPAVLVVDDEPHILRSIHDLLENDFEVTITVEPESALRRLQQEEVAVLVSDQRMPGLTGDRFLGKASEISQATRVLITGYTDTEALIRAVNAAQIYAYVRKPWEPMDLHLTVCRAARDYDMRRELRHERDLMHALMDNIPDSIFFKDGAGRFTRINRAHARLLGIRSPEEAIGKTDFDFFPPESAGRTYAGEQKLLTAWTPITDEVEAISGAATSGADGPAVYSTTKVPILRGPVREGLVGISRDITVRKRAEETQTRQTSSKLAELEQFANNAAHDLKAPLRTLSAFTQLLAQDYRGNLDPRANEYIDLVAREAARMGNLIDGLLAYAQATRLQEELQPTECEAVFRESLENLRLAVKLTGATVTCDPMPTVAAEPLQLMRLFQNLLDNALRYRGAEPPRVHVSACRHAAEWVFSVSDNGSGIDGQHLGRVFRIFQRLHGTDDDQPGAGVGLAICKRIVERHGGRIWVESEPAKGSTFYFTIPAQGTQSSEAPPALPGDKTS